MVEKSRRTRYSVTLTQPFMDGLDELVKRGLYLDAQNVIRESLRSTFEKHGVDPFKNLRPTLTIGKKENDET